MPTFKITLAYDGTAFAGWQMQAHQRTVQGVLEEALQPFDGERVVVHAAGRTDAGVHAVGQVVSFALRSPMAAGTLQRALNARLPDDVRVMRAEEAAGDFNARFHARRKTYHYTICTDPVVLPQLRHFVWHVPGSIDVERMNDAAALLLGEHDFAGFQAAGGEVISTRRTLFVSRVLADANAHLVYEVTGDGFLRHMVRNIVGTLVEIGHDRRPVNDITRVLDSRDRSQAAPTAPARGLTLWEVEY